MIDIVVPLEGIEENMRERCGGKATTLSLLIAGGHLVPGGSCITTDAYHRFVDLTGLRGRMALELSRKAMEEMRWEEMWDLGLRMRTMFLNTPVPPKMEEEMMAHHSGMDRLVVRSSSLAEDSDATSFAGIHDSFVNVSPEDIIDRVRMVWASLWSDRAILYRNELGLDLESSAMAVLIQKMIVGGRSGVVFTRDPENPDMTIIEAVPGLNQGMVDGTVPPDRWRVKRSSGEVVEMERGSRDKVAMPSDTGVELRSADDMETLVNGDVDRVFEEAMSIESEFGRPQDIEFTLEGEDLYILQARPITTFIENEERSWYRSLRRSYENLLSLRERIEGDIIPSMVEQSEELASIDLGAMSDEELADEIERRVDILSRWEGVYKETLIPFAHGMRLFGEVYNMIMRPNDPHQFMELLATGKMISTERNRRLMDLAARLDREGVSPMDENDLDPEILDEIDDIMRDSGGRLRGSNESRKGLIRLLGRMGDSSVRERDLEHIDHLEDDFLLRFEGEERGRAEDLLDMARASYRMRDDDNLVLGRIEGELERTLEEARVRLAERISEGHEVSREHVVRMLLDHDLIPELLPDTVTSERRTLPRQLVGQPAIKGIATGRARVIRGEEELFDFMSGEVLVCDALDPNMTFVAPLCSAIVERRGGMLIHGAIIAREYGIPCVTGIPDLVDQVESGDILTVDGFLGIVTVSERSRDSTT